MERTANGGAGMEACGVRVGNYSYCTRDKGHAGPHRCSAQDVDARRNGLSTETEAATRARAAMVAARERAMDPRISEVVADIYEDVLRNPDMNDAEKAGYIHAASRIDHRIPALTIKEAREVVADAAAKL